MKKYKIIANPAAGRGRAKSVDEKVAKLLKQKGISFSLEITQSPRDADRIARQSLEMYDVIVAVGGDGTVNEVLPAMLHAEKPLGIIPAGSGNDFVKSLNIPQDTESAVDILLQGNTRVIDAGRINDLFFVNGVGIGFDAAVNHTSFSINHSKRGLYLYLCALLKTLGKYRPIKIGLKINGVTIDAETFMVTIGNGTTCGGGFKLTPYAKLDDQAFDITIVKPIGYLPLFWHFPKVFLGTIDKAKKYATLHRADRISIKSNANIPVHVDGEIYLADTHQLDIEIIPNALKVIAQ